MNITTNPPSHVHAGKAAGFTLIELLVVMSLTMGLLLPAVQKVREAALRVAPHAESLSVLMGDGSVRFTRQAVELQELLENGPIDPASIDDQHAEWSLLLNVALDLRRQATDRLARAQTREEHAAFHEAQAALDGVLVYIEDVLAWLDLLAESVR